MRKQEMATICYTLQRKLRQTDHPTLREDLPEGTCVWKFTGRTMGVVNSDHIAVVLEKGRAKKGPFVIIPANAISRYVADMSEDRTGRQ